jgi:hypothetical protein
MMEEAEEEEDAVVAVEGENKDELSIVPPRPPEEGYAKGRAPGKGEEPTSRPPPELERLPTEEDGEGKGAKGVPIVPPTPPTPPPVTGVKLRWWWLPPPAL